MVYLDTSAAVPLFVPEPASHAVDAWLSACADPLASSDWIVAEFASALALKQRAGKLSAKGAAAAWRDFGTFCRSGLRLVPVSRAAFHAAAGLARRHKHGLRAGDALHLAVAMEIGATGIASLDAALSASAKRLGMRPVAL